MNVKHCICMLALLSAALAVPAARAPKGAENLAPKAVAIATSEYSSGYSASRAIDGKIPPPTGRGDNGQAWAVQGDTHRNGAELKLEWPAPVTVAEVVYYGRCSSDRKENFKDYAIYADAGKTPVAEGRLALGRGPQRIKLPKPVQAAVLRLKFLSSYGGLNPGASEIQVYSASPPDSLLGPFVAKDPGGSAPTRDPKPKPARKPKAKAPAPPIKECPELLAEFLAGPMTGVEEIVFAVRNPGKDGHWYANFSYYAPDDKRPAYGDGGTKLCRMNLRTGKIATLLEDPNGAVRDPQVHYDGAKIIFSYRKGGSEHYRLYEINADGSGLRRITDEVPYDDIEPTYLADGGIMFVSSRCKRWVNCWVTQVAVLYRCDADGGNLRMVSANGEHDNTPWPLPDGRILYTRWEYVDRSQVHYHHLWVVNPDGTAQMVYFGNLHAGVVMIDAKPIPGTDKIVSLFSPGHGRREHAGPICVVDPRMGPDEQRCVRQIPGGAAFRDPWAFSEHAFMAVEDRTLLLLDDTGRRKVLYRDAVQEVHEPRPLIRRPREASLVRRVDASEAMGRMVLADVNVGRNMTGVRRGEVKKLLVMEVLPKPINYTGGMDPLSWGGTFTLERVLGTVPVEADGSAYFELPPLRSVFFIAMDANDMSVKRMQSFVTVQPGETFSCVGCHEQRTRTMLSGKLMATRRPPSRIEPVAGVADVADFPRDVQPVLDRNCVGCHDYVKRDGADEGPRAGGVILRGDRGPMFSHSYATLTVRAQFVDGRNYAKSNYAPRALGSAASPIMKKLTGGHHGVKASPADVEAVRYWIESGAPYPGTYAALASGMIGGYAQNKQVLTDYEWPETKAAGAAIQRRCGSCHKGRASLPTALSHENGLSFWKPSWSDPRLAKSRHVVFNLTRPELSMILLAPLASKAGGLGMHQTDAKTGKPGEAIEVFSDTNDPDYGAILAMIRRGKERLDEIKRFDMPGFKPPAPYVREMKRYGVLPSTFDLARDPIDVYATDQAYWRSMWHEPVGE